MQHMHTIRWVCGHVTHKEAGEACGCLFQGERTLFAENFLGCLADSMESEGTEDAVTFRIFTSDAIRRLSGESAPSGGDAGSAALELLAVACREFVATVVASHDHIWQAEPFSLQTSDSFEDIGAHLMGKTAFGDNIEVTARRHVCSACW